MNVCVWGGRGVCEWNCDCKKVEKCYVLYVFPIYHLLRHRRAAMCTDFIYLFPKIPNVFIDGDLPDS